MLYRIFTIELYGQPISYWTADKLAEQELKELREIEPEYNDAEIQVYPVDISYIQEERNYLRLDD